MTDQPVVNMQAPEPPKPAEKQTDKAPVPYERFSEVNEKLKEATQKLTEVEKEKNDQLEAQLKEQGKWKEIAEQRANEIATIKPKADTVEDMEKTLVSVLEAQVASLPEDKRSLVPDEMTTQQKLSWLSKNAAILKAPAAFDIGAGHNGGSETKNIQLSPEEIEMAKHLNMTPEEYAKNK